MKYAYRWSWQQIKMKCDNRYLQSVAHQFFKMKRINSYLQTIFSLCVFAVLCTACGFQPQGNVALAPPLHRMYLQSPDPYGTLARNLQEYLKMSHVQLMSSDKHADTVLVIMNDGNSQTLLSVSGTTQTRQYNLGVTVIFKIEDSNGRTIVPPQTLTEIRPITVQSNQVLGSSNEANLFYQQMRRTLASAIMNRISSAQVTRMINEAYQTPSKHASSGN